MSSSFFDGSVVTVTGGTGSFGKTIVERLLSTSVKELRVFSRDEQKHVAMQRSFDDPRLKFVIGDVRDESRVRQVIPGSDIVFHAAAIKHVHLTEMHPYEAVSTNVIGAKNVAQACTDLGVQRLIAVSTDKAVQPVNVMGMTKALQERIITSYSRPGGLRAGCVRYGNVLASNGSVVPFFLDLARKAQAIGMPLVLPVTDMKMTRFMLTLHQAIDLVLFACEELTDGELFVSDLPSFFVSDLAQVIAEAFCGTIQIVGIRPGEKLHETLVSNEEMRRAVRKDGYYTVRRYASETESFQYVDGDLSSDGAAKLSKLELKQMLLREGLL